MCPWQAARSLPRTVGVSPAQDASLRAEANRLTSPTSARITSAVNGPAPGSWVKTFTRGPGPGTLMNLPVQPVDPPLDRADQAPVIPGQLAGHRRQVQGGEPGPARAGPVPAGRPVMAVAGDDGVDPVAQPGPQPHQRHPVAQQRPQLTDGRRGDPRLRQQVRPQQLAQNRRAGPCRSSASPRRSPCPARGAPGAGQTRNPPAIPPASWCRSRPRTRPGCPKASRRSPSRSAPPHWARSGSPGPAGPDRSPPPGSACGARRFRRKQSGVSLRDARAGLKIGGGCPPTSRFLGAG
jgi:hypothetical protein